MRIRTGVGTGVKVGIGISILKWGVANVSLTTNED